MRSKVTGVQQTIFDRFINVMKDVSSSPEHPDTDKMKDYENWFKKTSDSTFSMVLAIVYAVLPDVAVDQVA